MATALAELDRAQLDAALAGLKRIGASRAASLMARALKGADTATLEQIEADLAQSEIAAIRLEPPDRCAAGHLEEFPGPRSLVGLWDSMRSCGVEEKPSRLAEMERRTETDGRSSDRRCATCEQPVPTYKSKCRRCGRPYRE